MYMQYDFHEILLSDHATVRSAQTDIQSYLYDWKTSDQRLILWLSHLNLYKPEVVPKFGYLLVEASC